MLQNMCNKSDAQLDAHMFIPHDLTTYIRGHAENCL